MGQVEYSDLAQAVVLWTGWGEEQSPKRDDAKVIDSFGNEKGKVILEKLQNLETEFYSTDAQYNADTLTEMGIIASDQFRLKHPDIPEDIIKAFAWCYTYDYK